MPQSARLDAPGVLHHVMGRGIEKRPIFLADEDRNDFLSRLAKDLGSKLHYTLSSKRIFEIDTKVEKVQSRH